MLNARSIQSSIVLIIGLLLAVVMGNMLVTDTFSAFAWLGVVAVITICIFMGRRIWLLIPFMGALELGLRIPGQPSSLMLGELLTLAFCTVLFLMRKLPLKLVWTELEFWMLVLTLFVVQAYIRNPVGVNIFGGDTVGGKPYFLFGMATVSAMVLAGLQVTAPELMMIIRVSIVGGLLNAFVSLLSTFVPAVGSYFSGSFATSEEVTYENFNRVIDTGATNRITFLGSLTRNVALWVCSFISPVKALLDPFWGSLLLFTVLGAAYSGYRNAVVTVGSTYLVGLAYRGGFGYLMLAALGGTGAVAMLAAVNLMAPLPPNIQRSLTFLPGTWEQRYRDDAKGSSEWRYEIWQEVLTSDKYIQNKWMGDGLGFSSDAFRQSVAMADTNGTGVSGFDVQRENILVSGDYHSGPVQTIRVIGYIGLLFLLLAMARLAIHAHRQILRCRGTEWYPLALFTGIPLITYPFFFAFVFGDFQGGATTFMLGAAMVRMLQNNLPLPAYAGRSRSPYLLATRKDSPQPAAAFSSERAG